MKILLVEDDSGIVGALKDLLSVEGYEVEAVATQQEAITRLKENSFDLSLLDITLKEGSGFAVCAAAKEISPSLPVIFLTASDDEFSTVAGLDMGAADYIAKPFRGRELLSRLRKALRESSAEPSLLTAKSLVLDPSSAKVSKDGKEVLLSALEYRLLLYLLNSKGKLVTRDALKETIWESAGEYVSDNTLNVYISRLRDKVEDDPSNPSLMITVRGLGYKVCD